jgi:hypothetical protein
MFIETREAPCLVASFFPNFLIFQTSDPVMCLRAVVFFW